MWGWTVRFGLLFILVKGLLKRGVIKQETFDRGMLFFGTIVLLLSPSSSASMKEWSASSSPSPARAPARACPAPVPSRFPPARSLAALDPWGPTRCGVWCERRGDDTALARAVVEYARAQQGKVNDPIGLALQLLAIPGFFFVLSTVGFAATLHTARVPGRERPVRGSVRREGVGGRGNGLAQVVGAEFVQVGGQTRSRSIPTPSINPTPFVERRACGVLDTR